MKNKISVIVGRFQSQSVCDAMDDFIQKVSKDSNVFILMGLSPIQSTKENPFDFETRKLMLQQRYGDSIQIGYVKDNRDNGVWVDDVINQVIRFVTKNKKPSARTSKAPERWENVFDNVKIYGGEHTFVRYFQGTEYESLVHPLPNEIYVNEEANGNQVPSSVKGTLEFRTGVHFTVKNQYPKVYPTVDVAVFDGDKLLLARKPNENKYRFIGGFVDPNEKFEDAAIREVKEEANIDVVNLEWQGSYVIPDWRYINEQDSITTTLFVADYAHGNPRAQDDIEELRWVDMDDFVMSGDLADIIVPEHSELAQKVFAVHCDRKMKF
jgi:bifunctional NMN adenylyltransferase/nudix hydrolase